MGDIKKTKVPFIVVPYPARPSTPWKLEIRACFAGQRIRRFFSTEADARAEGVRLTEQIRKQKNDPCNQGVSNAIICLATITEIQAAIEHLSVKQAQELAAWLENYQATIEASVEDIHPTRSRKRRRVINGNRL